jgi:hypothetical protein
VKPCELFRRTREQSFIQQIDFVRSRPDSMACIIESAQTFSPQQFSQRLVKSQHRFILLFDPGEVCKQKLLAMGR